MTELYNEDGEKLEGFTKEETEKQLEETKASVEAEKQKEIDVLQNKITEFEGKGGKDYNFRKLDESKKDAEEKGKLQETELEELKAKLEKVENTARSVTDQRISESKLNEKIEAFTGGDEEVSKNIKFYYDSFKPAKEETDPVKREKMFNERVENAILLATGSKPISPLKKSGISSFSGSGTGKAKENKVPDEIRGILTEKMGISKKDIEDAEASGEL